MGGRILVLPHSDPCFSKWVLMVRLLGLACKLGSRHFPFALCCIFGCLAVGQQNKKGCPPKVLTRFYARSSLEAQGGWIEPHFICMCRESPRSNLRSLKSTSVWLRPALYFASIVGLWTAFNTSLLVILIISVKPLSLPGWEIILRASIVSVSKLAQESWYIG